METKDLIGLILLLAAVFIGCGLTCVSLRLREAAFFLMIVGAAMTHKVDINFFTHYWYRGTTRGLEVSLVDIIALSVLVSSILAPRAGQARVFWPASLGALLLLFVYAACSVCFAEPKVYGLFELSKMARGIVIFLAAACFVRTRRELVVLALALGCVMCLEGALSIKQRYLDGVHRVTGSLENENSFSMYLCLVGPVLAAAALSTLPRLLRWLCAVALALATLSVLLTISRAGIPSFAAVVFGTALFCTSWRITVQKIAALVFIPLALTGLVYKSWDTLRARYAEATFEEEYLDENIEGRGYYLRQARAIVEDRFFGVGLNNWSYWVSKDYGHRLGKKYVDYDSLDTPSRDDAYNYNFAAPAHNLAALTVGELGVPGLALLGLLWLRWFSVGFGALWRRSLLIERQLAVGIFFGLWGVFLQSVTEWTFRQTHIYLTVHLLAGVLAALCYWRRKERQRATNRPASTRPPVLSYEPAPI